MFLVQAQQFADSYQIIDQRANTSSGFSATLFKKGDEYMVAIRGTQGPSFSTLGHF
jgi:hypothetical protein